MRKYIQGDIHDVIKTLEDNTIDKIEVKNSHGISLIKKPKLKNYDTVLIAVAHDEFKKLSIKKIMRFCKKKHLIYDLKNILPENNSNIKF